MEWDKLTSHDFVKAVRTSQRVCLLPIGCIEKHGDHLPLGTDVLYVNRLCVQTAEKEPAVVFPYFYLSQISEAKHQPGTIAIKPELLIPLLESICDEISRNGLKKIIIVNGHGGNSSMLQYFLMTLLSKEKDYTVYCVSWYEGGADTGKDFLEAIHDGHGGEIETSGIMHYYPGLAKTPKSQKAFPLKRLSHLHANGISTPLDWYSNYPDHLCADGTPGSSEKGERMTEIQMKKLIRQIKLVKGDKATPALYREFIKKAKGCIDI
ncbi:MAG TPA: creatininase [Lentisphaeria bacterium]|nr:MAG: hypothetical protein A2X45_19215 [Lentisphaerae bacterium GWF2_50_93]HCE44469.1 creatininase [Lentisphaeria bacterium]